MWSTECKYIRSEVAYRRLNKKNVNLIAVILHFIKLCMILVRSNIPIMFDDRIPAGYFHNPIRCNDYH